MPDDPIDLPPSNVPPPVQAPVPRRTNVTCEFCECTLDSQGAVLRRGDRAHRILDLERDLEKANDQIAELKRRVAELTPPAPAASGKRSMFGLDS